MVDKNIIENFDELLIPDSQLCSAEQYKESLKYIAGVRILHVNIRSISCNFDSLLILLERINYQIDIIILSECWLRKASVIPILPNFTSYKSSHTSQNDGIVAYIKDTLCCEVTEPFFSVANCLQIKLSDTFVIVALYRSPSAHCIATFLHSLDNVLSTLTTIKTLVIIGDMNINIDSSANDSRAEEYLNLCAAHGLIPTHTLPTRNNNCLDHIILRSHKRSATYVLDAPLTDHCPVCVCCEFGYITTTAPRSVTYIDESAAINMLKKTDFSIILNNTDPEDAAEKLVSTISSVIQNHTRTIASSSRKRIIKPWITPGLLRCIRNRDKLFKKSKKNPNDVIHKVIYTRYKNFCNNLLKKIKRNYEHNEFQKAKNNTKKTWNVIKKICNISRENTKVSASLLKLAVDPIEAVNKVNEYFADVGKKLASAAHFKDVPQKYIPYMVSQTVPNSMVLIGTDSLEIRSLIEGLNNQCAVGWDGIASSIIKAAVDILTPSITYVCDLCLTRGVFPKVFKKAVIHPVFKKGSKDCISNYRPISVLSTLSKILEKLINRRLTSYLDKFSLLASNQYGFRSGRSTEDALMDLVDDTVQNMDKKRKTVGIFLDISKAFDTVSLPLLYKKLENFGIRDIALDLFKSYLSERTQVVKINSTTSDEASLSYGVPQGSVLGPTLFSIYMNELCNLKIPHCKIVSYADDTALIVHGNNWNDTREYSEQALSIIMNWLSCNILTLNIDKTVFITFGHRRFSPPESFSLVAHKCSLGLNIHCNCNKITRCSSIKYLGVVIDESFTWKNHILTMTSRIRKLAYIFKQLRCSTNIEILKMIYYALVQSILTYCIPAWGGATRSVLLPLERAQRCILKVMIYKPIHFPTAELYMMCKVLTVRQLFVLRCILRKHRLTSYDVQVVTNKRRFDKICQIEARRTALTHRQFYYSSPLLYNDINKKLNIYPLTYQHCKTKLTNWLLELNYDQTEDLLSA